MNSHTVENSPSRKHQSFSRNHHQINKGYSKFSSTIGTGKDLKLETSIAFKDLNNFNVH